MKVKDLMIQLSYQNPDDDVVIIDADYLTKARLPDIEVRTNIENQETLIVWSLNNFELNKDYLHWCDPI